MGRIINIDLIKNPANWVIIGTMVAFWLMFLSLFNQVSGEQ